MEPTMVQLDAPYGDAVEKIQDRWEDVMASWGHIKGDPDDNYNPQKRGYMGYYVGTNQDPAFKAEGETDNNVESVPAKDRDGEDGEEGEGAGEGKVPLPEKISVLQPLSYLRRADNNFFGGRTTFYT